MEHKEAMESMAAERYLLGELPDTDRARFEEHFFDCPTCAEDVRGAAIFRANARAVFADGPRRIAEVNWWEWIRLCPALAGSLASLIALLAGGLAYEAVVAGRLHREVAELQAPQSYPSFFLHGTTRGAEQVVEVPGSSRFFTLSLDLPPDRNFPRYLCEVSSESGAILFSVPFERLKMPDQSLNLSFPASRFEPGRRYRLAIRGGANEIGGYYFTFQRN